MSEAIVASTGTCEAHPCTDIVSVWKEIQRLGLEPYIAELEVLGLTVIPPEVVQSMDLVEELQSTTRTLIEKRLGCSLDWDNGGALGEQYGATGLPFFSLLLEEPVYQRMAMHPVALAIADYMVGKSCQLGTCLALLKGAGEDGGLQTHSDSVNFPGPFPTVPQSVNVTWPLSIYGSEDDGPLYYVPGSHRLHRPPMEGEAMADRVPVKAEPGSIIAWGNGTWHGAFPRTTNGYRLNIITAYLRSYIYTQEQFMLEVTKETLDANPPRFATLMGQNLPIFQKGGINPDNPVANFDLPGKSWWD